MEFLLRLNAFGVFVNALSVQVNQSNAGVMYQAAFFNEVTMKMYENQMQKELLHLQGFIDFFNAGKILC